MTPRRHASVRLASAALLAALGLAPSVGCVDLNPFAQGADPGDGSVGGSSLNDGSWATGGSSSGGDASSDAGAGGSVGGSSSGGSGAGPFCGNGTCENGESCGNCPADCPPGGTKDCYDNGLHANCCGQNSNTAECLACNDALGCPQDEYAAYCDRFSPGDNLWQQYHRNWVESQCGGSAQNDGNTWYCTNPSTCTTYTCAM